jgi:hypothetical protein
MSLPAFPPTFHQHTWRRPTCTTGYLFPTNDELRIFFPAPFVVNVLQPAMYSVNYDDAWKK